MRLVSTVDVGDIAQLLDEYIVTGRPRMTQVVHSILIGVFKKAQYCGEVPPDYNPTLAAKQPRREIIRQRLSPGEWRKIFDIIDATHRYMGNAMSLALVTGQRLGNISRMRFGNIWDGHLHVT